MKMFFFSLLLCCVTFNTVDAQPPIPVSEMETYLGFDSGTMTLTDWVVDPIATPFGESYTNILKVVGINADGNTFLGKIPGKDVNGQWVFQKASDGTTGETCTGDPCESCKFVKEELGGGCDCKRPMTGVCTHTITKE